MRKTKTGYLLTPKELGRILIADEVNIAIAKGKVIETEIYRTMEYCPKVKVLCLDSEGGAMVLILEGEEANQVQYYRMADSQLGELRQKSQQKGGQHEAR